MPLLVHAVLHALRMHRQAVQHARLPDGEIGNVDHLLDLAIALGLDLAVLQRYQAAERVLVAAQLLGHQANRLAALGRRHLSPALRRGDRGAENMFVVLGGRGAHPREALSGRRIDGLDQRPGVKLAPAVAAGPAAGIEFAEPEGVQRIVDFRHSGFRLDEGRHFDAAAGRNATRGRTGFAQARPGV